MSEKVLKRLVAGLAAAVILYVLAGLIGRNRNAGGSDPALASFLQRLGSDSLPSITLTSPAGESFQLVRGAGTWTVNDLPADSAAISRLQRSAREAKIGVLISSSEANQARLGVSTDSAWTVEIPASGGASKLLVGRNGSRMSSAYVRLPDETNTWELTGDLRGAVVRTLTDWRDKTIARIDTTKVATMDVTRDGGSYTLSRKDSSWVVSASRGAATDSAKRSTVNGMLSELARLDATGFTTDTTATDSTQRRRLVVRTSAGDTLLSIDAAGTGAGWHLVAHGNRTIFDVPSYLMDRLIPKREDVASTSKG